MKITTSLGAVYGRTYYCVEPWFGSDHIPLWQDMEAWVIEIMGPSTTSNLDERWYVNSVKFWFRDEQDRVMFLLRWS